MAVHTLKQTLDDFRRQLDTGEEAYRAWRVEAERREGELTQRLEQLGARVRRSAASRRPFLSVVSRDA